jgi:AraC-like DNA-binding protein
MLLGNSSPEYCRVTPSQARLATNADMILSIRFADISSLCVLARELGVSPSYLARIYRRATGATLHGKIARLRLSHALARLAAGTSDLTALAIDLGYSSHSHFTAEFTRYIGQPPSAFRLASQV